MKVLQFIPSLNKYDGGTTTYMQQLTPALGKEVELHVCALTPVEDFVPLEYCVPHSLPLSLRQWREMKSIWMGLLEEIQPDVVHFNCCWFPHIALLVRWTKQYARQKPESAPLTLLTPHGMLEPWIIKRNYWTRKLPAICLYQRKAVKEVDCVVATAIEEKEHLLQLGWNKNIALIQNGIDVHAIEPRTAWRKQGKLLFMSRVHPKKGLELLFEALRRTAQQGIELSLQIAGDGEPDYVARLKGMAPKGVTFLGAVYGEEKWKLIREAGAVILPSYSENYGLIVAEALAAATPVIATTGAPWSCVKEAQAGWWVEPSADAIEVALKEFATLGDESLETMGKNARKLAEEECGIERTAQSLLALYRRNCR